MSNNANFINGKQYPYGFNNWIRKVAFILIDEYGCYQGEWKPFVVEKLALDAWLIYFMDGLAPSIAIQEYFKQGG